MVIFQPTVVAKTPTVFSFDFPSLRPYLEKGCGSWS